MIIIMIMIIMIRIMMRIMIIKIKLSKLNYHCDRDNSWIGGRRARQMQNIIWSQNMLLTMIRNRGTPNNENFSIKSLWLFVQLFLRHICVCSQILNWVLVKCRLRTNVLRWTFCHLSILPKSYSILNFQNYSNIT